MVQEKFGKESLFLGIRNVILNFGEVKNQYSDKEEGKIFVLLESIEYFDVEDVDGETDQYHEYVYDLFYITIKGKLIESAGESTPKWKKATTVTIYKCVGQYTHEVFLCGDYLEGKWLESKSPSIKVNEDLLNEYLNNFLTYGIFNSPKFTNEHQDKFKGMIKEDYWYDKPY